MVDKTDQQEDQDIVVRVSQNIYTSDVYILIPPKYWDEPGLAEAIKLAVDQTVKKGKLSGSGQNRLDS